MGETAVETQREIGATRDRMTRTVDELDAAVRHLLDWQARVRRNPALYVGIALTVGFVAAGGPRRALRDTYYLLRPSARWRAQANQHMLRLRETLDATIAALPEGVAEQARQLRLEINTADPRAKGDGTIVIQHKGSTFDQLAIRAAEAAASVGAGLLIQRLIDELDGKTGAAER